jgi:hypothetical protein
MSVTLHRSFVAHLQILAASAAFDSSNMASFCVGGLLMEIPEDYTRPQDIVRSTPSSYARLLADACLQ